MVPLTLLFLRHDIETPRPGDMFDYVGQLTSLEFPVFIVSKSKKKAPSSLDDVIQEALEDGRAAWESDLYGH